ncbi:cupin domain-containing protein [Nocardioides marinus]|uniref:Cupin domain-containing protein n=1 Tax=Nocardioides marinus TaxID=374514 RepID=A0A7Y9YF51_9ACTN|nr:cupin domain-containing protein [Nocardioides marinus]NYI11088.1 hypothetical protein [Nocardioides marinus]
MRIAKQDIPTKIDVPGAKVRQLPDFGTADGLIGAEHFSLDAGLDISPLLQGLPDDACQSPHWGFVVTGALVVTYTDGTVERCSTGDLFHWPAGHSVAVQEDAEVVVFSPTVAHTAVLDHMLVGLAAPA